MFIDGVSQTVTQHQAFGTLGNLSQPLIIGKTTYNPVTRWFNGWLDEIRILKGTAYWTSGFTAPTAEHGLGVESMTLISDTFVAETEPDDARMVILEEDVDSITLNTDLKAWVTRDDGTNWEQGTLSDLGDFDSSKRILTAEFDLSEQDSDTDMKYKLTTHNSKQLKIHASALNWK